MMRDRLISVRVNGELYQKVQDLIDSRTNILKIWDRVIYEYSDSHGMRRGKVTVADILEKALRDFLSDV